MQNSLSKKRLLIRRVLPLVLAMVLLLSTAVVAFGGFGAGATGLGTNETLYFNLSKNSSWYTNGSGDLYARFYKGSTLVGNVKCTMQSTNIYKATSPAVAADTVQLAVYNSTTEKDLVLNDAKTNRVYLLNTKNWSKPYLYNWKDGSKNDGAWPGKDPGMTALSGKMYYYEITKGSSYKYVIFSNKGDDQTGRRKLKVGKDILVFNLKAQPFKQSKRCK